MTKGTHLYNIWFIVYGRGRRRVWSVWSVSSYYRSPINWGLSFYIWTDLTVLWYVRFSSGSNWTHSTEKEVVHGGGGAWGMEVQNFREYEDAR